MTRLACRIAACALLVGTAQAHESASHSPAIPAPPAQEILAPGYGELGFAAPPAGSYSLPPLGLAADGAVLDSDGAATTLHEVFGDGVVLLSFVYAHCPDVNGCPLATAVLHRLGRRLREAPAIARRVQLVSLSFDPTRDTPAAMRRYGESFSPVPVDWRFVTTTSERELAPILDAYGQSVRKEYDATGTYLGTLSHLLRVFLIDPSRHIRNVYTVSFLHPDTLLNDIETVLLGLDTAGARLTVASPVGESGRAALGPGDHRGGYDRADYQTRSTSLAARRGRALDLVSRAQQVPLGLPPTPVPSDNPLTHSKVALGRKLFYDRRLSSNGTLSCGMCHIPEQGFTSNELRTPIGIEGRTVRRNAISIYNAAHQRRLFHDGRETQLEYQVWGPLLAANEMGNPSIGAVVEKLGLLPDYRGLFEEAFPGEGLGMRTIGMALASYERTLVSGDSPFDRWYYGRNDAALGEAAQRGFRLFTGSAGCSACHTIGEAYALFSDGELHNTGVGYAATMLPESPRPVPIAPGLHLTISPDVLRQVSLPRPSDLGAYEITQRPSDRWKYKTPSLRNVALTAPYMHDGSLSTLAAVVAFYDRGGVPNEALDPGVRPLDLDANQRADLTTFLGTLTGSDVAALVQDGFAVPTGAPTSAP